jgi:RNA polymerase sigma-70 factor, ECF subfamily
MSAPPVESSGPAVRVTPASHRRLSEQLHALATTRSELRARGPDAVGRIRAQSPGLAPALHEHQKIGRRLAPSTDPIPRSGAPQVVDVIVEPAIGATRSQARRLDRESRAWVEALDSVGLRRDEAIRRLHALLYREAWFEVRRRAAPLTHPSGGDLDDLAVQAADDAVVTILAKLDHFRGDSLFTTWARRFAQREAPAKLRRRLGRGRELPMGLEFEPAPMWPARDESPHERCVARESARTLARLIAEELTAHQREVLIALAIDGVATEALARRLDTTTGALYKTLHDARRKLKRRLADS